MKRDSAFGHRIAFLLSSLKFGGGERVALNLAHAFKARGIRVDFVLMSAEGEFLLEARQHFTVVDLACNRTWKLPGKLAAYLWRQRPDGLIASFWKLNLCACLARLIYPTVRLALWEHSPPSRSENSPTFLYAVTASLFYRLATRVVAVSTGVHEDIRRITLGLGNKLTMIFNAIPPPTEADNPPRSYWKKTIVWVGRLDVPKNPGLMLEAFARLPQNENVVLKFVGDGPLRPALEANAAGLGLLNQVGFLGYQARPYLLMQGADLLVLTSDREGLPTVLVEALYCGLSVVSTDCGRGIHDILGDNVYGAICTVGDPNALAQSIAHALRTPRDSHHQMLGAQRFKPEVIAGQFLASMRLA
jgi:glycosyltransferase involved in cell wall biosynthesis